MKIVLDTAQARTYSTQIFDQIVHGIESLELKKGDTLPSERSLSEELGVSRGTIRKAYKLLEDGKYIVSRRGSHYYITGSDANDNSRRRSANLTTDQYLGKMLSLHYSIDEIKSLVNLKIMELESSNSNKIHLGIIECRNDSLYTFKRQLEYIPELEISLFLVDEFINNRFVYNKAINCDLLVTTASHYYDVAKAAPEITYKLVEVVSRWADKTIFDLASITPDAKIGIVYSSPRTISLIESALKFFKIDYKSLAAFNENNLREFERFCSTKSVLIGEPLSILFDESKKNYLKSFLSKDGKLICFDHYIDKGSLMQIEKAITSIIKKNTMASSNTI